MSDETCIHCDGRGPHYDVTDCLVSYKLRLAETAPPLKRATDVGLLDCYPSVWLTYDGGQSVCVLTSDTGQTVRGVGADHDAARADALRLAGERFGR